MSGLGDVRVVVGGPSSYGVVVDIGTVRSVRTVVRIVLAHFERVRARVVEGRVVKGVRSRVV